SGSPVEKEKEAADACTTSRSKASALAVASLPESVANPNHANWRRTGVSSIVFVLFPCFIINMFWFICCRASDWNKACRLRMCLKRGGLAAPSEPDSHLRECEEQGRK